MHIEIPHKSSKQAAVTRLKQGLVQAKPHLQGQAQIEKEDWNNDTLTFTVLVQSKEITGTVVVTDNGYVVDAKLPLLWRMFEGKIERMIAEQAASL